MNTRFNPTTNGTGHLGHAYIAILNYHAAKSSGGEFIVRFDDDQEWWVERLGRAKMAEYAEAWKEDLEWLGIVPDRYTSEAEERGSNEALMAAFPLLEIYETVDTEEVNHSYAQIVGWPHSYPVVSFLTASKVIQDHREGIDLLIRGMDLLTEHCLYGYFCRLLGYPMPQMLYVPRLVYRKSANYSYYVGEEAEELTDISKAKGGFKIREYREAGWKPEELVAMLAVACLEEPAAGWIFGNVKESPALSRRPEDR